MLGFQNCSGKGVLNATALSSVSNSGAGLEGARAGGISLNEESIAVGLFLTYLEDGECADGKAKSVIRHSRGVYTIERLDCEPILPAQVLQPAQITIDTQNPLVLFYAGRSLRQR